MRRQVRSAPLTYGVDDVRFPGDELDLSLYFAQVGVVDKEGRVEVVLDTALNLGHKAVAEQPCSDDGRAHAHDQDDDGDTRGESRLERKRHCQNSGRMASLK